MQRIALVDDVEASNRLMAAYLKSVENTDTRAFTNPVEAISWCREFEPDLIIVDYMMPELDGLSFIRRIRSVPRLKDTPVIMVTGDTTRDTLYETLQYGTTDFLRKPVDGMELLARARNLLQLRQKQRELRVLNEKLLQMATTDSLTGVSNRRSFMQSLEQSVSDCREPLAKCSLAIIDLDHFKSVNDNYGHDGGDRVLRNVSRIMGNNIREGDVVGRLGGEEFAILMPKTDIESALSLSKRILEILRTTSILVGTTEIRITASIGLAQWRHGIDDSASFLLRADQALYSAKSSGRDRIVLEEPHKNVA